MCNIYTNEHYWVIGSSTSQISAPYVGQPCQCGSVRWQAAQQPFAPDALRVCGKCGLSEQNHADHLCNPNYSAGKA